MEHDKQFHFRNGSRAASLDELKDRLETISYDEFYHHVEPGRNDFANWIRYVLKDPRLAEQLEKVDSIVETVEILEDYLRPHARGSGMQDRIEESLGVDTPAPDEAPPALEEPGEAPEAPNGSPEEAPPAARADDLRRPDEEWQQPAEEEQAEDKGEEPVEQLPDDLEPAGTGRGEEIPGEQAAEEKPHKAPDEEYSHHYHRSKNEREEIDEFHHQLDRVIVKDFIWGMLFGLIVGFVLARMLML